MSLTPTPIQHAGAISRRGYAWLSTGCWGPEQQVSYPLSHHPSPDTDYIFFLSISHLYIHVYVYNICVYNIYFILDLYINIHQRYFTENFILLLIYYLTLILKKNLYFNVLLSRLLFLMLNLPELFSSQYKAPWISAQSPGSCLHLHG